MHIKWTSRNCSVDAVDGELLIYFTLHETDLVNSIIYRCRLIHLRIKSAVVGAIMWWDCCADVARLNGVITEMLMRKFAQPGFSAKPVHLSLIHI